MSPYPRGILVYGLQRLPILLHTEGRAGAPGPSTHCSDSGCRSSSSAGSSPAAGRLSPSAAVSSATRAAGSLPRPRSPASSGPSTPSSVNDDARGPLTGTFPAEREAEFGEERLRHREITDRQAHTDRAHPSLSSLIMRSQTGGFLPPRPGQRVHSASWMNIPCPRAGWPHPRDGPPARGSDHPLSPVSA